jgi:hypothetical protein
MKSYLILIDSSSTEHPYVLTIQEDGNTSGGMPWRKEYVDEASFTQDLNGCMKAADDKAVAEILRTIAATNHWATKLSLTDECATRLGWRH